VPNAAPKIGFQRLNLRWAASVSIGLPFPFWSPE
jgi:hypothetical protein